MNAHRICFVSPLARPILEPEFQCDFGGAEVRAVNFAGGLARKPGFEVSMVLRSYRNEPPRRIGSVTAYFETADAPIKRTQDLPRDVFFPWNVLRAKWQKLDRSIRKRWQTDSACDSQQQRLVAEVPADVIACFGVQQYSAKIVRAARQAGKKSVLFIAHDQDLDFDRFREIRETYGGNDSTYRQVVETADHIVCQTPHQQQLLQSNFQRRGDVVRNPIDLGQCVEPTEPCGSYILWVGRADTFFKRADKMLELARRCPVVPFVAIMNRRNPDMFRTLVSQAPENVRIVEHVPYEEIENYYANATALLSTSVGEGFPNAFLQAGKYGQPILSLDVDPGEMISQHGCGVTTRGDLDALERALKSMWNHRDGDYRRKFSENIRRYVCTYHDLDDRMEELKQIVQTVSRTSPPKQAA